MDYFGFLFRAAVGRWLSLLCPRRSLIKVPQFRFLLLLLLCVFFIWLSCARVPYFVFFPFFPSPVFSVRWCVRLLLYTLRPFYSWKFPSLLAWRSLSIRACSHFFLPSFLAWSLISFCQTFIPIYLPLSFFSYYYYLIIILLLKKTNGLS